MSQLTLLTINSRFSLSKQKSDKQTRGEGNLHQARCLVADNIENLPENPLEMMPRSE
jgi:hypothetical protein